MVLINKKRINELCQNYNYQLLNNVLVNYFQQSIKTDLQKLILLQDLTSVMNAVLQL